MGSAFGIWGVLAYKLLPQLHAFIHNSPLMIMMMMLLLLPICVSYLLAHQWCWCRCWCWRWWFSLEFTPTSLIPSEGMKKRLAGMNEGINDWENERLNEFRPLDEFFSSLKKPTFLFLHAFYTMMIITGLHWIIWRERERGGGRWMWFFLV